MKTAALLLALFGMLALAIVGASLTWSGIGDAEMSADGYIAPAFSAAFSALPVSVLIKDFLGSIGDDL